MSPPSIVLRTIGAVALEELSFVFNTTRATALAIAPTSTLRSSFERDVNTPCDKKNANLNPIDAVYDARTAAVFASVGNNPSMRSRKSSIALNSALDPLARSLAGADVFTANVVTMRFDVALARLDARLCAPMRAGAGTTEATRMFGDVARAGWRSRARAATSAAPMACARDDVMR